MRGDAVTPVAAAVSALAVFACCVPLGFAGALSVFAIGSLFDALQPWFMTAAAVLFSVGVVQAYRARRACRPGRRRFSLAVLAFSGTIVLLVLFFPQLVAGVIADYIL